MKHTFISFMLAAVTFAACTSVAEKSDSSQEVFTMSWRTAEPDTGSIISASVWDNVPVQTRFSAPWSDNLLDATEFQCYLSPHYFYFRFQVPDETITLQEPFLKKLDVCNEDRAEIFLSATPGMETYYCMEIDPQGRALDYVTNYYRQFDYDWSFQSLQIETIVESDKYFVAGRLSTAEMLQLGILAKEFYMGVFRADFDGPEHVVWYSLLRVEREKADFHIPEMLYKVVVEEPQTTHP
ncbi:MAG: hypothetical protein K5945_10945 [Bacteroidaceae bacterium]|nr:hypothetical protein [Bacteroidaceae bacterium]